MDLFASQTNAKVPVYYSLNRQDQGSGCTGDRSGKFVLAQEALDFRSTKIGGRVPLLTPSSAKDLLSQGPLLHPNIGQLNLAAWLLRSKS